MDLMGGAKAYTLGNTEGYQPYTGQRLAPFTAQQQQVQQNILAQQTPGQFGAASGLTAAAGLGSLFAGRYDPTQFRAQQIGQPNLQQFQMAAPQQVQGQQNFAPQMDTEQTGFAPNLDYFQMATPQQVQGQQYTTPQMGTARTGFAPNLDYFQMGPVREVGGFGIEAPQMQGAQTGYGQGALEQFRTAAPEMFGQAQAEQYMSPYIRNVMDIQKREAIEDARKSQIVQDLGAARQGTYGGSRQLLAGMSREKALGQQLGDIEARGLQSAFQNAQEQFERDRAAGMTTGQQNLQAALQQQQLGVQTGLQTALANLSNEQQARVSNQAAQLQASGMNADQALRAALANQGVDVTRGQQNLAAQLQTQQLGTQTGLQSALANLDAESQANVQNLAAQLQTQGLNADQALRAALANQQAGLTTGQQNLAAQLQTQQLGTQTGLQSALANLDARSQANVQNLAAQLQTQGLNSEQALRAALANQQAGLTTGQQNLQALLGTQQLGTESGLRALLANQQYGLEAQRLAEQSRQFGSQQALAGFGQAGQMGQTLSNIGTAQQQTDLARLNQQQQTAAQEQALRQQLYDLNYQDFMRQQNYPLEMLQQYSSLLRGVPVAPNTTQTTTMPNPSLASQIMGTGLGALGAYKALA
jgi:hypothetical protein